MGKEVSTDAECCTAVLDCMVCMHARSTDASRVKVTASFHLARAAGVQHWRGTLRDVCVCVCVCVWGGVMRGPRESAGNRFYIR